MTRTTQSVVVGVEGSESSLQAALWAADEAQRLSVPLRVILVSNDPSREPFAKGVVRDIVTTCHRAVSDLEITEEVIYGHPAEELVHRSSSALLVAVGSRGHGAFRETLLGSTSAAVAMHGLCPVVVVPSAPAATSGPVVVGVDSSAESRKALRYAFETAARRHSDLIAVQALPNVYFIPGPYDRPDRDELLADIRKRLAEQVSAWTELHPEVAVRQVVSHVPPVQALRESAQQAQLLVVGHRGLGGFPGLSLGSVARTMLYHPPCPIAVIPE